MKAWKVLLGAGLLTAATQANATVTLYLQQADENGGAVTKIGSGSTSYSYNNDYGAFSVSASANGSGTTPNFFTQTLDVSNAIGGSITIYLVNSGLSNLTTNLLSTFSANGYNVASVVESTYLSTSAMFDPTNLGTEIGNVTFGSSSADAALGTSSSQSSSGNIAGNYSEITKYVVTTSAGGGAANSTINITAAVPEPASWAMMLAGFGFIGMALRSRRRPVVTFG